MNLMSTEWTKRLHHIDSISTIWTLLISDKPLKNILRRIETLLNTIDQKTEYRHYEYRPEKLDHKKERREDRYPSEKNIQELMWDNIPEKHKQYLKKDNPISKGCYREYHRVRTIDPLISKIELIEHCKNHSRK